MRFLLLYEVTKLLKLNIKGRKLWRPRNFLKSQTVVLFLKKEARPASHIKNKVRVPARARGLYF